MEINNNNNSNRKHIQLLLKLLFCCCFTDILNRENIRGGSDFNREILLNKSIIQGVPKLEGNISPRCSVKKNTFFHI